MTFKGGDQSFENDPELTQMLESPEADVQTCIITVVRKLKTLSR